MDKSDGKLAVTARFNDKMTPEAVRAVWHEVFEILNLFGESDKEKTNIDEEKRIASPV